MDFNEKVLYHQIHPAKLAADVSGSLVSTYLMWRRRPAWAVLAAFVPAVVASVLVIAYADLERRKHSPLGRYMQRYMNRRVEAWRFFGQVVIWVGAWYRVGKLIPIGWAIVVAAWASGVWRKPTNYSVVQKGWPLMHDEPSALSNQLFGCQSLKAEGSLLGKVHPFREGL
jgi:hypothetical protein